MIDWKIWFTTGIEHILDWNGYDHMLFVALLALMFELAEWKRILLLITAFTVGHSITLALSTVGIINLSQNYTELFIAVSIALTAIIQLFSNKNTPNRVKVFYLIICCFGLIHGLGFSYLLKSMLGHEQSVLGPLLLFNLGLEVGQVIFVLFVLIGIWLTKKYITQTKKHLKNVLTLLILIVSLILCYSRFLNILHE